MLESFMMLRIQLLPLQEQVVWLEREALGEMLEPQVVFPQVLEQQVVQVVTEVLVVRFI
jgi:hypothetical protein